MKKDYSNQSEVFKIFKLCLNAIVLGIAILILISSIVTVHDIKSGQIDFSGGNLPGAGILAYLLLAFATMLGLIICFLLSFVGLICALIGRKRATDKVFRYIYTGFSCVYVIIMIMSVILFFI